MYSLTRYRALSAGTGLLVVMMTSACPENPAQVQLRTLTLLKAGAGTGSVVATPAAASYADGTTVSITAAPASGSAFTGWSGDCTGPTNPCSITMSADRTVTGTFTASSGAGRFDGQFAGSWSGGQSDGSNLTGTLTLTITNGAVQGTIAPISGSVGTFAGAVSASGAITTTIAAANNGCSVSLPGQVTTSSSGGTTGATITGTCDLLPSVTCKSASGTWTATRR